MKLLIEKENKYYHAYHGTGIDFDKFERKYIGSNGIEHGYGFYFTNNKEIAQAYGNIVIEADLEINNPLSLEEITVTKEQVKQFIRQYIDNDGNGYLSNYGDINNEDYDQILNKCVDNLFMYSDSDEDLISELLYWSRGEDNETLDAVLTILHKDGIIYQGYDSLYGEHIENYIVFSNNQIHNKKKIYF